MTPHDLIPRFMLASLAAAAALLFVAQARPAVHARPDTDRVARLIFHREQRLETKKPGRFKTYRVTCLRVTGSEYACRVYGRDKRRVGICVQAMFAWLAIEPAILEYDPHTVTRCHTGPPA